MSSDRQLNYVNNLQNRDQNLYYVDDASELNSINLEENDKIYAINDNKLFQMEIVDREEELSGSIVSFNGRNNTKIKSLVANIEPQQDLHGYDNPWPAGGNINLLPPLPVISETKNGITFTSDGKGNYTLSGTATQSASFTYDLQEYSGEMPNPAHVHIRNSVANGSVTFMLRDGTSAESATISYVGCSPANRIIDLESARGKVIKSLNFYVANGVTINTTISPSVETTGNITDFTSYSNICPISGWTGAEIPHRGKNIFPPMIDGTYMGNGVTAIVKDGVATLSGTTTASGNALIIPLAEEFVMPTKGQVYFHALNSVSNTSVQPSIENSSHPGDHYITYALAPVNRIAAIPMNYHGGYKYDRIRFYLGNNITLSGTYSPMMCFDDSASNYVFYTNSQISVDWEDEAGIVYSSTLTINPDKTGSLMVDMAMVDLGTLTWNKVNTTGSHWRFWTYLNTMAYGGKMLSSQYKHITATQSYNGESGIASQAQGSNYLIMVSDERFLDAATFKAAMSGVQLLYELASPIIYTLTESEISNILTMLYGTNNIWANTGDIIVKIAEKGKTAFELKPYT